MKKLLAMIGIITCVFSLSACGSKAKTDLTISAEEQASLIQSAESLFLEVTQLKGSEYEEQASKIAVYDKAMESWGNSIVDIGEYDLSSFTNETAAKTDEDTYEVNFDITGSKHNATVTVLFDEVYKEYAGGFILDPTSVTTNVSYSFGELMGQAGSNTVLGMGTTFVILILLSLIISLFKFIPAIQKAFSKKKEPAAAAVKTAPAAAPAVVEEYEDETDEGELVAVIAAAIAASRGETTTDGFVVRSVRRAGKGWRR